MKNKNYYIISKYKIEVKAYIELKNFFKEKKLFNIFLYYRYEHILHVLKKKPHFTDVLYLGIDSIAKAFYWSSIEIEKMYYNRKYINSKFWSSVHFEWERYYKRKYEK